jgi:hypothetical protein
MKIFLFFTIFAFFAVKIMYSLFRLYPLQSSRNEINHFMQVILFVGILFFMTNLSGGLMTESGISIIFLFGTLVGLQLPLYTNYLQPKIEENSQAMLIVLRFLFVISLAILIITLAFFNLNDNESSVSYFYTIFTIFFIVITLIITRNPTKYFKLQCAFSQYGCCGDGQTEKLNSAGTNCEVSEQNPCETSTYGCCADGKTAKNDANGSNCPNIYVQTEGQNIELNVSFLLWLILFLFNFKYNNSIIRLFHGFFFGALISSISFNGMGFLLDKSKPLQCNSPQTCGQMGITGAATFIQQYNTDYNKGIMTALYVCSILLIIMLLYFIYRRSIY